MDNNHQAHGAGLVQPAATDVDAALNTATEHVLPTGSPVVHFAGDWHGHGAWAIARVMSAGTRGIRYIFHAGDFGIWPGKLGKKYLLNLDKACARFGVTLVVTPGNHEDWGRLSTLKSRDRGNGLGPVQWVGDHIAILPRGHRLTLVTPNGSRRTFVSLGGAPSIDFATRKPHLTWWPEEMMSLGDVYRVAEDGHADIMVTHDAPGPPYAVPRVELILRNNPGRWDDTALRYAAEGRKLVTAAYEAVRPQWLFHGHYHAPGQAIVEHPDGTRGRVVSLDEQHTAHNIAQLDLDVMELVYT